MSQKATNPIKNSQQWEISLNLLHIAKSKEDFSPAQVQELESIMFVFSVINEETGKKPS